jgi:hypothetical protein
MGDTHNLIPLKHAKDFPSRLSLKSTAPRRRRFAAPSAKKKPAWYGSRKIIKIAAESGFLLFK